MENRRIYFYADNEDTEYRAVMGGFKPYVVVQNKDNFYRVIIYTLKNLTYSYRKIVKENGVFDIMQAATVLVKRASKKRIVETILRLSDEFFDALRPLTQEELDDLLPANKMPFSEWIQVYPENKS